MEFASLVKLTGLDVKAFVGIVECPGLEVMEFTGLDVMDFLASVRTSRSSSSSWSSAVSSCFVRPPGRRGARRSPLRGEVYSDVVEYELKHLCNTVFGVFDSKPFGIYATKKRLSTRI